MNILIIAPYYPYATHPAWGAFNERTAHALSRLCNRVAVLAPRPYAPPVFSRLIERWKSYSSIVAYETRNGIPVYRPRYIQVPRLQSAFLLDHGLFRACRTTVLKMHTQDHFDVVLSFDLVAAGCLAWRVGKQLNIPAAGWAIGNDLRVRQHSSLSQLLLRALVNLNLVFYQSQELLHIAQSRLIAGNLSVHQNRHVVLSRGVPLPPHSPPLRASRYRIRAALQIERDEIAVVNIGRVVKAKGVFDLVDSISLARAANHNIICMIVGSKPEFDDTDELNKRIAKEPRLRESIRILPSCPPDKVWEYLTAADIFAFTSHAEGMPNSILEAMSIGLASIAFGIPPILELDNGSRSLIIVPPFDIQAYAQAILNLASSLQDRTAIGDRARRRVIADFNIQHKMAEALRYLKALTPSNCGEI